MNTFLQKMPGHPSMHHDICISIVCGYLESLRGRGVTLVTHRFETAKEAQECPAPFTTYSLFFNGKFITNEILSEKKFEKILSDLTDK